MIYILYVAMVVPIFTSEIIASIIAISDDLLFYKNKLNYINDLEIVDECDTLLGYKIIVMNRKIDKRIALFVSKKGLDIINNKIF